MSEKNDGFQYYEALSHSAVLSERLIGWSGRWLLFGHLVVCKQCQSGQSITVGHEPFGHKPDCGDFAKPGQNPWSELAEILAHRPLSKESGE